MTIDTLLTGETIVTATHMFNADIAITDGKISAISS